MNGSDKANAYMNEESVISVAVTLYDKVDIDAITALSREAEKHFSYYELLLVANPSSDVSRLCQQLMALPNSRLILLNAMASESTLQSTTFEHAIGDHVVLFDLYETDPSYLAPLVMGNINGNNFTGLCYGKHTLSVHYVLWSIFAKCLRWLTI